MIVIVCFEVKQMQKKLFEYKNDFIINGYGVVLLFLFVQVKFYYFVRCFMEWLEKGFFELDDVCGNGICLQIKVVIFYL